MIASKFTDFYKRYEKYISPVGLIYGFIFTSLTLTRVDMFLENFWIVLHLLIVCAGILAFTHYEKRAGEKNVPESERIKFHFYLTLIIQFAYGGLFSTFFIFYLRSSSLVQSWLFLLFLLALVIGNELWKKYYERLTFQISILYVSIYLFLVFLLPVLLHRLGADLFIMSGVISLVVVFLFLLLLKRFIQHNFDAHHKKLRISVIIIFVIMNVLYFTNIIPPIPLALKDTGVYHNIIKVSPGSFQAKSEPSNFIDNLLHYPVLHKQAGEPVYVYSAVFSPVAFSSKIIHQWQYFDEVNKKWVDSSRITLPISGGRDGGYRTYSMRDAVSAGSWRVKVMTTNGQVLGNINFVVENGPSVPNLITINL